MTIFIVILSILLFITGYLFFTSIRCLSIIDNMIKSIEDTFTKQETFINEYYNNMQKIHRDCITQKQELINLIQHEKEASKK